MAFVTEAALIALREGLEALLITGILLGMVTRLGRRDARKHVWVGFSAAVAVSVVAGFLIQRFVLDAFESQGGGEWFELVAALAAVAVLTYMVGWMWKHTRELMTTVRGQVEGLLTRGALVGIVFLTFASVIREGLEVVLFYSALATRATPFDLAWSGLVGLLLSAGIVYAILKGAAKVDLQKFFAVTGLLLVLVAAGLLVHSVSAATALGLIEPAPMIWDTSGALADDSALGRVLHAIIGYTAQPTLLQALLYFGYVFGLGGWYLWSLGAFHTRAAGARRLASNRAIAAGTLVILIAYAVGMGAAHPGAIVEGHSHGPEGHGPVALAEGERFGVLLRSHGEPVHYNETTYQSFADFVENLLVMFGMENLLLVDQGTVLLDKSAPFAPCTPLKLDAQLMDAWTRDHAGPALCVTAPPGAAAGSLVLDGYYLAPGAGPGLGEPDILEMAGLASYTEWLQMDNASPMHETKGRVLDAAERMLRERYGDRVVVQRSYHVLPHVGDKESDADAGAGFADSGVGLVVDAYTSAVFSDVMNTCMMIPHLHHALDTSGYSGKLAHAAPSGLTHTYAHAVAAEAKARLAEVPAGEPVALFLTHHGQKPGSTNPCGSGEDQYHANAKALHEATLKAIAEEVQREGLHVFQVYGGGANAPDDGMLSPLEAVEEARALGIRRVLDLPYELTGDGFDNLVVQRRAYGLEPERAPHYDAERETRLTVKGVDVRILSSAFGTEARAAALVEVIEAALAKELGAATDDGHGH
jgi:high-affinity iron transporter